MCIDNFGYPIEVKEPAMPRTGHADEGSSSAAAARPVRPDRSSPPPVPRWVKAFGLAAVGVIVLFVVVHLSGVMPMGGH
jgi:hypothetical protein